MLKTPGFSGYFARHGAGMAPDKGQVTARCGAETGAGDGSRLVMQAEPTANGVY